MEKSKAMRQIGSQVVISQLPPPHHGSTVMTQVYLETLSELDIAWHLVDRRFSSSVGEIGKFNLGKVVQGFLLLGRLLISQVQLKPSSYVLFITNRPASFIVDWVITEIIRMSRRPLINYVHTSGFRDLGSRNRIFRFLVKRALSSATQTVCLGDTMETDISWAANGGIIKIPNTPYRLPKLPPTPREEPLTFLFLSNLLPEKGAEAFITAALQLAPEYPSARFVVAGAAPDDETTRFLESKISGSPYAKSVSLIGGAAEEHKWRLLDSAHALVFPSTYKFEAQPLTIVEAMSRALPVIAFDTGGVRDLVTHEHTGILLPSPDVGLLADAMRRLADDSSLRAVLGRQALHFFETRLSRSAYANAWKRVLTNPEKQTISL
ncbi:UNVERIFIED_CONTAM: glycosyltransferase family 4 protein [Actinomycetes bacterium ARC8]|nr:glycosyltransferase family 4 protein [Actinomycetes bacterium ARC8]